MNGRFPLKCFLCTIFHTFVLRFSSIEVSAGIIPPERTRGAHHHRSDDDQCASP